MQIHNIGCYNSTRNLKSNNTLIRPHFGKNDRNPELEKVLNDKTLKPEYKECLQYLLKNINHLENALIGTDANGIKCLAIATMCYAPIFECVLRGDYAVKLSDKKTKPIVDLESIAKHNLTHSKNPINLWEEINKNNIIFSTLVKTLKDKKINSVMSINLKYNIGDIDLETNIVNTRIPQHLFSLPLINAQKTVNVEKLKNEEIPDTMKILLASSEIEGEKKNLLWQLSEIPFFNAAIKNLSTNDLKDVLDDIYENKPFSTEALKGNISITNIKTKKEKPIIDIKAIAIHNELHPNNKISLYEEFCNSNFYTNVLRASNTVKKIRGIFPSILIGYDDKFDAFGELFLKTKSEKPDLMAIIEHISNMPTLSKKARYLIYFRNDLNTIEQDSNNKSKDTEENEEFLKNLIYVETPHSIEMMFKNPKISPKSKKYLYYLGEIPYFHHLMKNSTETTIKHILYLAQEHPKVFNKLISGKMYISSPETNLNSKPVLNLKEIAKQEKTQNNLLAPNTFEFDLCEEIGKYIAQYDAELIQYTMSDTEGISCKIVDKNKNIISFNLDYIPKSIEKYLLKNITFTISFSE